MHFRDAGSKSCNMADQWRPLEKTPITNVLNNDSVVVDVDCGMVSTQVEVRLILMKMLYVSIRQWKIFLDLNEVG